MDSQVRVALPPHLRTLARVDGEVLVAVPVVAAEPPSISEVLDALEHRYPMLLGTIRDQASGERRPFIRYFVCGRDVSHDPPNLPLPVEVVTDSEPLSVIGAIAGG